jgi:hypothetical protein
VLAQAQCGGAGEREPGAGQVEQARVDVDAELAGAGALVLDGAGEGRPRGAEVEHAQGARGQGGDDRGHLLHVLEGEKAGVGEVEGGAGHAVHVQGDEIGAVGIALDQGRARVDRDRAVGQLPRGCRCPARSWVESIGTAVRACGATAG